jgi:hypothetical protein
MIGDFGLAIVNHQSSIINRQSKDEARHARIFEIIAAAPDEQDRLG